jgi:hypothetical protein
MVFGYPVPDRGARIRVETPMRITCRRQRLVIAFIAVLAGFGLR